MGGGGREGGWGWIVEGVAGWGRGGGGFGQGAADLDGVEGGGNGAVECVCGKWSCLCSLGVDTRVSLTSLLLGGSKTTTYAHLLISGTGLHVPGWVAGADFHHNEGSGGQVDSVRVCSGVSAQCGAGGSDGLLLEEHERNGKITHGGGQVK